MEKNFWILAMQQKLSKRPDLIKKYIQLGMSLYLFGSAIQKQDPNDLDIVMLYHVKDMTTAQKVRDITVRYLRTVFDTPIDCVLMSFIEEKQICFTMKEKAMLIFSPAKCLRV